MFERVKRFLELAGGGNLMLQHGKAALNEQFDKRLVEPNSGLGKALRYLIRHTAYHIMDHAWEMEDKDLTKTA